MHDLVLDDLKDLMKQTKACETILKQPQNGARLSLKLTCCNPSLGLATTVKACKGAGQEGSLRIKSHAPGSG
jgi:hypothetical protein